MRALVLRDFYDIAVEERPDPVPGSGQAVVEVIATGICGSDFRGTPARTVAATLARSWDMRRSAGFGSSEQTWQD
jgi:D-arabinose 1-dehydrogenase-like Zn-dependent alcohol dehydrogenase